MATPVGKTTPGSSDSPETEVKNYFSHDFGKTNIFFIVTDSVPEEKIDPQSQHVNPANAISHFEKAFDFFKKEGIPIPSYINVFFDFYPGSGTGQRSHVGIIGHDIFLDMEENIETEVVVHELIHCATRVLCSLGGEYTYLAEGFAIYMEEKFAGQPPNFSRSSIDWALQSDEFSRSEGNVITPQERIAYRIGYEVWKKIEKAKGKEAIFSLIKELEASTQADVYWKGKKELLDNQVKEATGKTPKQWVDQQIKRTVQENFGFFSELSGDLYIAPGTFREELGISLTDIGPLRVYLRGGFPLFSNDPRFATNPFYGGLSIKTPPLYPWMRWNSQGVRLGELEAEGGIFQNLKPYGEVNFDLFSYGITTKAQIALRANVGGSLLVYNHQAFSSGLLGLDILF